MEYKKLLKTQLKNKLSIVDKKFLYELHNYLFVPIYLYGSILRGDYFPEKSDIDVAVFVNDVTTTIDKLVVFLGINRSKIKVFKLVTKNKIIYGFKTNYIINIPHKNLFSETFKRFEISVYNIRDKEEVLENNIKHITPPFFVAIQIFILKYLYYYMNLNHNYYRIAKENIFNTLRDYNNKVTIIASL